MTHNIRCDASVAHILLIKGGACQKSKHLEPQKYVITVLQIRQRVMLESEFP